MNKLIKCEYNMDTACVELCYSDGSMIAVDCLAVENEYACCLSHITELDYLIYNDPLAYADLVLTGDVEEYLRTVTQKTYLD